MTIPEDSITRAFLIFEHKIWDSRVLYNEETIKRLQDHSPDFYKRHSAERYEINWNSGKPAEKK